MRFTSKMVTTGFILAAAKVFRRRNDAADETDADSEKRKELDAQLNSAIMGTFPASDPYSVGASSARRPDRPLHRRPATIDTRSVDHQAELLDEKRRRMKQ